MWFKIFSFFGGIVCLGFALVWIIGLIITSIEEEPYYYSVYKLRREYLKRLKMEQKRDMEERELQRMREREEREMARRREQGRD